MRLFLPTLLILLLPTVAAAQLGGNCTWQTTFTYDAAGNRIQRKDACVPNPPVSQSGTPGFRMPAPAGSSELTLQLYPNPGEGAFTLSFSGAVTEGEVAIYELSGKQVYFQLVHTPETVISLPHAAPVLYLVRATANGEVFLKKWTNR